ncbi:TonB-dependent receptor [Flavihumibacter rivuli]|uniref:TonB-dependent receptor n=1 Tax=Flavihumibacter rivuli TaxID=2838156 RepID=UPI001BDE6F0E|nr:TonB-dependent receptor [Flavihumibacter rivuli]ULQ57676.1 TonB-dependent receptor [Flavihumibacter rivuli]
MRKSYSKIACMLLAVFFSIAAYSQAVTVKGNVKNSQSQDAVPAVSVTIKGTNIGTFTDDKGNFSLTTNQKPPFTLVFTSIGFETQELNVANADQSINVSFAPSSQLGTEVVVSASRVPERILESPVSIERVNRQAIVTAPAAGYYDIVANLKGVDMTTASLTFKTPSTRGFNGSGNTRFNQIVDGMDNQAPGLNFSVGSIVGLNELDVDNMELLPGASSALYGPGGMNGTLLINSKNPFRYNGLSFQVKAGMMHTDGRYRDASAYHNWAVRWAQKVGERFAYKITGEFIHAQDWLGADYRNYARLGTNGQVIPGTRATDPNYDGVNVYGDETTIDLMKNVLIPIGQQAYWLDPYITTLGRNRVINVSRTGYTEKEIVDPNTVNFKLGGAMHYKLTEKLEAVFAANWGTGNTVYTGSERYSLRDLKMGQYKLELNHKNWYIRGYTTQENAGQSYNATVTTRLFNEAWKPSATWYSQYGQAFLANLLNGRTEAEAHAAARAIADQGRPAAGSEQFRKLFDAVRSKPISEGGGLFVDKTDLYNIEGQYNLSYLTGNVADILVGGNYKIYNLNSEGTLFADSTGPISITEYGAYIQATRKFFGDVLKLSVSGRYDKNENFKGRFTPRATAVIQAAKNHNFRLSYQTAYRFPSTQQQWINLAIGSNVRLIGGVDAFRTFYNFDKNPVFTVPTSAGQVPTPYEFTEFKPEAVQTFEIGYKSLLAGGKVLLDAYGYWGTYQDFLARTLIMQATTGNPADLADPTKRSIYSIPVNLEDKVKTYGFGLSVDYRFYKNFVASFNVSSDKLSEVPEGYVSFFNTPEYRTNLTIANSGFGKDKRLGFAATYKWQKEFFYESDFANGTVPEIHTVDAQVSYKLPKMRSLIKIGANNLLNQYYYNAMGNPMVGGLYYVGFGYNVF